MFKFRRAIAIAKKEVKHILRDPFTLTIALALPVFLTTMFGFAIDFDIHDVQTALYDADMTQTSRVVYQTFTNSGYFKIIRPRILTVSPELPIARERAKISLIIPHKFEENLYNGRGATAQILLDGADNTTAGLISGYLGGILQKLNGQKDPLQITPRYLFNPEQKSPWFIVPGLSTVILAILSILLTALTVAREWETGSMELLLSTPARPTEIILGKLLPYIGLGFIALTFIYIAARTVFGIPFTGSHLAYAFGSLLFIGTYLSMGLFISITSRNQQLAMQISLITGYMPSILLSGFVFSIQNMSPFWQMLTKILPASWYMTICRACYLKGASFGDLIMPFIALTVLFIILFSVATKKFTGTLEK